MGFVGPSLHQFMCPRALKLTLNSCCLGKIYRKDGSAEVSCRSMCGSRRPSMPPGRTGDTFRAAGSWAKGLGREVLGDSGLRLPGGLRDVPLLPRLAWRGAVLLGWWAVWLLGVKDFRSVPNTPPASLLAGWRAHSWRSGIGVILGCSRWWLSPSHAPLLLSPLAPLVHPGTLRRGG